MARILAVSAVLCLVAMGGVASAQTVAPVAPVDLHPLWTATEPYLLAAFNGIITVLFALIFAVIKKKTGIDIEAKYAASIHSAAMTGVSAEMSRLDGVPMTINTKSALVSAGVAWVEKSVPDAIKALGVTPDKLETIVEAKVGQLTGQTAAVTTAPITPAQQ